MKLVLLRDLHFIHIFLVGVTDLDISKWWYVFFYSLFNVDTNFLFTNLK